MESTISGHSTLSAPWIVDECPQNPQCLGRRQQVSTEEWENLKPLIRRLYKEEGRTYAYIANVLREHHNFNPMKKQFDDRIRKWGYRKNTNKAERRSILASVGSLGESSMVDTSGRKLDRRKLHRWQKEFEGGNSLPPLSSTSSIDLQRATVTSGGSSEPIASIAVLAITTEIGPLGAIHHDPLPLDLETGLRAGVGEDSWPFNRWANFDVIGSPKLSRLFENLKIETGDIPADVESLVLSPPPSVSVKEDGEQYIAGCELTITCHPKKRFTEQEPVGLPIIYVPGPKTARVRQKTRWTPFKFCNADAWLPTGAQMQRPPSPSNELYLFPENPVGSPKAARATVTSIKSRRAVEAECKIHLSSLKRAGFGENHRGILVDDE